MKKFGFAVVALCAASGAAQAITLTAQAINSGTFGPRADTVVYSHIDAPYSAFAAGNYLGFDDYVTTEAGPTTSLNSMRFVGGVTVANTALQFNFYNAAGTTLITSFALTFGTAGNFIWTITDIGGESIASDGIMEVVGVAGATGRWFLSTSATTVGSDDRTFGDSTTPNNQHSFELSVPAPGSLALLGLGGIIAGRRRR